MDELKTMSDALDLVYRALDEGRCHACDGSGWLRGDPCPMCDDTGREDGHERE